MSRDDYRARLKVRSAGDQREFYKTCMVSVDGGRPFPARIPRLQRHWTWEIYNSRTGVRVCGDNTGGIFDVEEVLENHVYPLLEEVRHAWSMGYLRKRFR